MIPAERKEAIKALLRQKRSVTVAELSSQLQVSTETIRRDLSALEREGFLEKNHGGATLRNRVINSLPKQILSTLLLENKRSMAQEAAKFVQPGDCIFLDSSTTVFEMCSFLQDMPLTVVSAALDVIMFFSAHKNIDIVCPGGNFDRHTNSFRSVETLTFFQSHNFDKAFISCRSINLQNGLCDSNEITAEFHRQMITASTATFLLMDHTKLNKSAFVYTCPLSKISTLIVDTALSEEWIACLGEQDVQYLECPVSTAQPG